MARATQAAKRDRGEIEALPSGSLRVKVYAGIDKVTRRRLYLTETVKPQPRQAKIAEEVRTRFLNQVDEQRNPKTRATVNQLFERYFEVLDVETTTLRDYRSKYRLHVGPYLGKMRLTELTDGESLDSLYAEMRRCSKHCHKRKNLIDHRTDRSGHVCDEHRGPACVPSIPAACKACRRACKPHVCEPLADSTVREVHWILSGGFGRATKWKWFSTNPADFATPPAMPKPDPRPPSAGEAAELINGAYDADEDWGEFIFSKATTGNRRSEHCALQWHHFVDPQPQAGAAVPPPAAVLVVRQALFKSDDKGLQLKDTKTHQQRRVVLDHETRLMLRTRYERKKAEAAALKIKLRLDAFIFSPDPDGLRPLKPDTATQRFGRMAKRLGIVAQLKGWRSYNATELIAAGVDLNVVAARIGHGGGGSTTLKSYTAYQAERSQRAADALIIRMPSRPKPQENPDLDKSGKVVHLPDAGDRDLEPYRRIAADLRGAITSGFVLPGMPLPSVKALAERYGVAPSTAHRAVILLVDAGLVTASRGVRAAVAEAGQELFPAVTRVT